MREGWKVKTLGEVCQIKPPKKEARERLSPDDLVSFVPMKNLGEQRKELVLDDERTLENVAGSYTYFANEDVLLAKITPCFENGKLGIARNLKNGIGFGSSEYIVFRSKGDLEPEFLYYFLSRDSFRNAGARAMKGAVGHKRVSKEFIETFPIPLPPLAEQNRIVGVLDQAFAGIEQALAAARKNRANARALFETTLNTTFTQKGEGWVETTLGETCEFSNGKAHEKDIDENGQFIVVNSKFISQDGRVIKKTNEMKHPLFIDDIVMVMSDVPKGKALAKCFLIRENNKYSLNQRICSIRSDNYLPKFLVYQLSRHPYLLAFDNKGSQANLRKADILSCPLFLPSIEDQKSIVARLDGLKTQTQALEALYQQKIDALDELKQSLLQKAFAGKLTATQEDAA